MIYLLVEYNELVFEANKIKLLKYWAEEYKAPALVYNVRRSARIYKVYLIHDLVMQQGHIPYWYIHPVSIIKD